MITHEVWLTRLFNTYLAGLGNWLLALFHQTATDARQPWADFIVMQLEQEAPLRRFERQLRHAMVEDLGPSPQLHMNLQMCRPSTGFFPWSA